jgi:hypothetical protein
MRVYELAAFAAADQAAARGVSELIQFACWRPGASSIARIAAAVSSPTMKEPPLRHAAAGNAGCRVDPSPVGCSSPFPAAPAIRVRWPGGDRSGTLTWLVIGWHGLVGDLGELAGRRALGGRFQR